MMALQAIENGEEKYHFLVDTTTDEEQSLRQLLQITIANYHPVSKMQPRDTRHSRLRVHA